MDEETTGIDTQSDRVVDQGEGDERQQGRNNQQQDIDLGDVAVHPIHEIHLIGHISHLRIPLQLGRYPLQGVAVGIVRLHLQL